MEGGVERRGTEKEETRERMTERGREPAIYSRIIDGWLIG